MIQRWKRRCAAGTSLVLALCSPVLAHAVGVRVAVSPETLLVAPGDTFTVQLRVPVAGSPFNTYDAVLAFDPAVLRFIGRPQAEQEGPLLPSACPGHSTFYVFAAAGDSLDVLDSILGAGCVATGPGTLLNLRFTALGPTGVTHVRLRRVRFYDDGLYVTPVQPTDALIAVGITLGTPPPAPPAPQRRLVASPNPSRGACWFALPDGGGGASEVRILDTAGRLVRSVALDPRTPGRPVPWDGRDASGRRAPPGVYAAVLGGHGVPAHTLLVRLP
jgi:hypothetical protein